MIAFKLYNEDEALSITISEVIFLEILLAAKKIRSKLGVFQYAVSIIWASELSENIDGDYQLGVYDIGKSILVRVMTDGKLLSICDDHYLSRRFLVDELLNAFEKVIQFCANGYKPEIWMFSEIWSSHVGCENCLEGGKSAKCWGKITCHGYENGCGCKHCYSLELLEKEAK